MVLYTMRDKGEVPYILLPCHRWLHLCSRQQAGGREKEESKGYTWSISSERFSEAAT